MDGIQAAAPVCTFCHVTVRPTDFFCYNCGRNLHEPPKSVGIGTQILYYAGSILMPPMGIFWGIKYLREQNETARRVGLVCIALTVVSMLYFSYQMISVYNRVSGEVRTQMEGANGLF
jgi:hypothetical protein